MPIYVFPHFSDQSMESADVEKTIQRARVDTVTATKLYDIYRIVPQSALSILQLTEESLSVLIRDADELVPETPVAVSNVPGASYTHRWNLLISQGLFVIDWKELEVQLLRSGTLATSPSDLSATARRESRSVGARLDGGANQLRLDKVTPAPTAADIVPDDEDVNDE